ncbi:MAG: RNA polymerase sigma-70 factor [Bacteroidales bacterium]|nr:RNA polymerase sigma-70 factor [Bacteroidales bacterium]
MNFVKGKYDIDSPDFVTRIVNGDCEAYNVLYKSMYKKLCAYANVFLKDLEQAEEIVQNTICKIWENRESLGKIDKFQAYLIRSVKNAAINAIKHVQVQNKFKEQIINLIDDVEDFVSMADNKELNTQIQDAIDSLPEKSKAIFVMSRYEEMKYSEIAEKTGISIKTVEYHITSALKQLSMKLQNVLYVFIGTIVIMFYNMFL